MNCTDFKNNIADLFDKSISMEQYKNMTDHAENCQECKAYYNSLQEVADALKPQQHPSQSKKTNRWKQIVAAVAIFAIGLTCGMTHFFSQEAEAHTFNLVDAISYVKNVGSYIVKLQVRTTANENFEYFDPNADFIDIEMTQLASNDSIFWRVEKAQGRTVVNDGKSQYLWLDDNLYVKGTQSTNFLGNFHLLLDPCKLLNTQQLAIELGKDVTSKVQLTDSTAIITTTFNTQYSDLQSIYQGQGKDAKVIIENICSLKDGLLRSIKIWLLEGKHKTEIVHSTSIIYNIPVDKEKLTAIPQDKEWVELENVGKVNTPERLTYLQHESAQVAAERIINAILNNSLQEAQESLVFYQQELPELIKSMKGCKAKNFQAPKHTKDYAGVYVCYDLIHPNGKKVHRHIALRNDNTSRIWIADGGL